MRGLLCALACARGASAQQAPAINVREALELDATANEDLATKNQAMGVWHGGAGQGEELVVALVHQHNDMDRRIDDRQFAVAWASNGVTLEEVWRSPMSCPDVELVVPSRGPYVYEARLDLTGGSLHPECSCQPSPGRPCPHGVRAIPATGQEWNISSPIQSHFVVLENEWEERIADPAVLGALEEDVDAPVVPVSMALLNSTVGAPTDPSLACPGTYDDPFGSQGVSRESLEHSGMHLPAAHVAASWCLVRRGGCSETAKVKVCELSGAVGTIIVDHGHFAKDQEVVVRYLRALSESAGRPVLFVSEGEGRALTSAAAAGLLRVVAGPSVGGPPPPTYSPGAGITVRTVGGRAPSNGGPATRRYPDLFATAGWLEASAARDLLFVCLPHAAEVRVYDISEPLVDIRMLGRILVACSGSGHHDYRVLDYRGPDGRFRTVLVDPANYGNRLYYYDTEDLGDPRLERVVHADWEADLHGLGQVRPGGPGGRYHFVTWHCSNFYCGKEHGDSIYVLDTLRLSQPPRRVYLPMLSRGIFVRDVACGDDGVCIVSLTEDGLVAIDSGTPPTVNPFEVVAWHVGESPFSSSNVPWQLAYLHGAQKVYASRRYARRFYVEHANFSIRQLRAGDHVRAVRKRRLYLAEVAGYDSALPAPAPGMAAGSTRFTVTIAVARESGSISPPAFAALLALALFFMVLAAVLLWLVARARRVNRMQRAELDSHRRAEAGYSSVVVGRPVDAHRGGPQAATHGEPVGPAAAPRDARGDAAGKRACWG